MKSLRLITRYHSILIPVYRFAKKNNTQLYLVGGILRDILLGRKKETLDFDFCIQKDSINFAARLAREIHAGFVVLDKEHGACRLVKRMGATQCTLDFTDFRGRNLKEDLLHRDFTINMMALELNEIFKGTTDPSKALIDFCGARKDLHSGVIRAIYGRVFDEDPLRILRAFSLASTFRFTIEPKTTRLMRSKAGKLSAVSSERIRDELFKVLEQPDSFRYLAAMDTLKILKVIIPEIEIMRGVQQGPYHHLDVWKHSLETVRQLEEFIQEQKRHRNVQSYLDEVVSGERKRRALLKLGALLHDIGKPGALRREEGKTKFHGHERIGAQMTEALARRLRLSNDEVDSLQRMVFWHLRPGYLADNEEITPRARFRYFRDTAQEGLSILMLSIADQRSTRGPLTSRQSRMQHERVVLDLVKEYFRRKKEKKLPRLITGDDLIREYTLKPSPLIGKILSEVEELQAIGKLKSRKEALEAARRLIP